MAPPAAARLHLSRAQIGVYRLVGVEASAPDQDVLDVLALTGPFSDAHVEGFPRRRLGTHPRDGPRIGGLIDDFRHCVGSKRIEGDTPNGTLQREKQRKEFGANYFLGLGGLPGFPRSSGRVRRYRRLSLVLAR